MVENETVGITQIKVFDVNILNLFLFLLKLEQWHTYD